MIKIEFIGDDGVIEIKGAGKLLEIQESLVVKHMATATPKLFKLALANNIELLQKEVTIDTHYFSN